jgi:hypothetical protein
MAKLDANNWQSRNIAYEPELTRVQKFKLQKSNLPDFYLRRTPGIEVVTPAEL